MTEPTAPHLRARAKMQDIKEALAPAATELPAQRPMPGKRERTRTTADDIRKAARDAAPDTFAFLAGIVGDEMQAVKDRISAARVIIEWAVPKPAPERDVQQDASFFDEVRRLMTGETSEPH